MAEERENVHKFRKHVDLVQPVGMVGEAAADFGIRQVERSDENYLTGVHAAKRYSIPVMEAMALVAAREMAAGMKAEVDQIALSVHQAERLVRDGRVSMADLGDKRILREKLGQVERLSGFDKRRMVRFRQYAHDMLLLRHTLKSEERFGGLVGEKEKEHLGSADFFDLGSKKTNDLLKLYFRASRNDVLRSVNPAALDEKQIGRLIKTGVRNGFSAQDEAALRLVERQIRNRAVRIRVERMVNIRRRVKWLKSYALRMDETAGAGLQNAVYAAQTAKAGYAVAKFGLKTGIVAASFVGKYTGVSGLIHGLDRVRQRKTEQAIQAVKQGIRRSRPYQAAVEKRDAFRRRLDGKPAVQKFREIQKRTGERRKAAARKVNRTRAAARAAGRRVNQGLGIVFSPVRAAGRAVCFFRSGLGKVRLFCMAAAGGCVVFFLLLVVLVNAILSICRTEAETAFTYIMTEDDSFISGVTVQLQGRADGRLSEAERAISEGPEDSYVYGDRQLAGYGCPDGEGGWTVGGKVVCVDGNGSQLLLGANNIKDAVVVSYLFMDAGFDGHEVARDELILDVWQMMNPEPVLEESEIYTCQGGCETFHYSCDSQSDLAEMERLMDEGVAFFGNVEECDREPEKTGEGAGLEAVGVEVVGAEVVGVEVMVEEPGQETGGMTADTGGTGTFSCGGHSVSVCYGHRDLTVYVPVISMEEIFRSGEMPVAQGKAYQAFLQEFAGWTAENMEWAESLYQSDWFELYGTDPSAGSGGLVEMGAGQINAIRECYGGLDGTRVAVCEDAMSFVGKIPYYWGGKAVAKSYEGNSFYSTVAADYKGRDKRGLDCSGFVQWTVWRVTDVKLGSSTATITSGMEQIGAANLQPGDLGLMALPGSASNHVGIFVGYDGSGRALWCHENSSAGNVSVDATTCFRYYFRSF